MVVMVVMVVVLMSEKQIPRFARETSCMQEPTIPGNRDPDLDPGSAIQIRTRDPDIPLV